MDLSGDPDVHTLLNRVQGTLNAALEHQAAPFEQVVDALDVPRSLAHTPVFQVMFDWQVRGSDEGTSERWGREGLTIKPHPVGLSQAKFDLSLSLRAQEDGSITGVVEYDADLFDASRIVTDMKRWERLLGQLIAQETLTEIDWLDEAEHQQLADFNVTEQPVSETSVSERFYATAADYPDARALVCGDDALTYRQLHKAASKLARYLIAQSIGPDDVVGICLERSSALIIAMLGVVHSGAAYLPLDPAQPDARLKDMLEDSRAKRLITEQAFCPRFSEWEKPEKSGALAMLILDDPTTQDRLAGLDASPILDSERTRALLPGHLAYLIYTSGSTGKPKAVGVTQAGWSNLIVVESTVFGVTPEDRVLQFASMIFDASVWELSISLATGATMIMASSEERNDHKRLAQLLTREKVNYAVLPRAIASALSRQDLVPVRMLILAGETCPNELVARFAPGRRMFNAYGPTETTVSATLYGPIDPLAGTEGERVPIGRPIANTRIHLLDGQLRPVLIGAWGELYIAGAGLARGYVGRSDLTAERFIACPFGSSGTRMYRSGDLARWREDGVLEFGGRADQQIKLRGFRVEPGEIEVALCAFESIDQAVVLLREIVGEPRLVAYLIPTVGEGIPDNAYLREQLGKTLPDYMIPAAFVSLESWPLTTSGKVNRKALPDPEIVGVATFIAPVSTEEALFCRLFAELTGATRVSVEDNFFALGGGHSLLAMRLVSAVRKATHRELPLRAVFEQSTPRGLGALLAQAERKVLPPIVSGSGLDSLGHPTLSWGQERLWTLDQMDGGSSQYNIPLSLELLGSLDVTALLAAIRGLVIRHAALRTVIVTNDRGEPRGQLLSESDLDVLVSVEDLSDEPMSVVEARLATLANHRFDLSADALLYGQLLRLGPDRHMLALVLHHAAADGHSISVLLHEFFALYQGKTLPSLPYSYADHAFWQRSIQHEHLNRDLTYWQAHLQGLPECLDLPLSYPRRADRARRAGYHAVSIPALLGRALAERAAHEGITLFSLLLASWGLFLGRMACTEDVVIGTPFAGRMAPDSEGLVGFFVNTLALRIDLSGDPDVHTLLNRVQGMLNAALEHQAAPFEQVVDALDVRRSLAHTPVFQVVFDWQIRASDEEASERWGREGLTMKPYPVGLSRAKFDLSLSLRAQEDGSIAGVVEYDADLFKASRIATDMQRLERLLGQLIAHETLTEIDWLDEAEYQQLVDFNAAEQPVSEASVSERFYATAADYPDTRALVCGDDALTYRQLHEAASKLARYLIAQSIGPEDVVGICLERSTTLLVAMLGVVHSGAAYLPLDPAQPEERLKDMLEDSRAKRLITEQALCSCFAELVKPEKPEALALLILDDPTTQERLAEFDASPIFDSERTRPLLPGHLAYLIYTSGSTGKPKAVGVTQGGWSNLIVVNSKVFGVTPEDRVLQFASMIFDASVWELLISLTTGATMIIASSEERNDHKRLVRLLRREQVSYAVLPRAIASALSRQDLVLVRMLTLAGETCPKELVARFAPGRRMFNVYGPTETTVSATLYGPIDPLSDTQCENLPIGRPIVNAQIHILDVQLRPVPIGVWGELYIAGAGLARGYVGRSGLTAERFIACPFGSPGTRMYRSGDLARWREDGVLEFGGRADQQIKLRGFRIEPGEIEAALCTFESIDQAVVLLREIAGEPRLVAYLTPIVGEGVPDSAYLRERLGKTLPDYMIPAAFVPLESWPLTTSGKINRKALPDPEVVGEATFIAPASTQEALLCRLFAELTGATRVSVDDNFFALGGHSLLAMRLVSAVRKATHRELPLRAVFEQPTPRGLSTVLEESDRGPRPYQPLLPLRTLGVEPPLFCIHSGVGMATEYRYFADALSWDCPVYGIQARGIDSGEEPMTSIQAMACCYAEAIQAVYSEGPYRLLGWSFGGNVACEVVRLLEQAGQLVEFLILGDTYFDARTETTRDDHSLDMRIAEQAGIETEGLSDEALKQTAERWMAQQIQLSDKEGPETIQRIKRVMQSMEKMERVGELDGSLSVQCPVLYIRASDNQSETLEGQLTALTSNLIDIVDVEAIHRKIFSEENSQQMAALVVDHFETSA